MLVVKPLGNNPGGTRLLHLITSNTCWRLLLAAGGFSLYHVASTEEDSPMYEATKEAAFRLLVNSEALMRKGVGTIYRRFLNSQILLSRLENNKERLRVFEFLAKCHTPLEERTTEEKKVCGNIVTSEIDEDEFISKALFSVNLSMVAPLDDISFQLTVSSPNIFDELSRYLYRTRYKNALRVMGINSAYGTIPFPEIGCFNMYM